MSAVAEPRLLTAEDLLKMPDDGKRRWLVRGELREDNEVTYRNRDHGWTESQVVFLLKDWLRHQPRPRGSVLSGDAGFWLRRDPDTLVGIDVAYISAELTAASPSGSTMVEGSPVLAVEVLSPNTTVEQIQEKLGLYREAAVPLVWFVNPFDRTVTVHRHGARPVMLNDADTLTAEPHMPGFAVPVAEVFER